ncbi:u2 small nuclear ribonucleo a [Lecanosticta acicola]|uniref:U2 small nuclear ribonucleoprotein A' n=1 Tax=Lecanosticta acicola TaxID=111012 RepID=A0AAI9EG38_9PEZI|nr:u2 small nuclear ribonucleo a [Lecanosticta acicola]
MRLTAELINSSLSYNNPLNERELDLRGHKIPGIENLGVARDQECIDFTDNNIQQLANFPLSPRLQSLLLTNNRVHTISESLGKNVPNLHTLVLTKNNLSELADLEPLMGLKKLVYVSLMGNPVATKENYRYWLLWRCPQIRFLDYQKVKDSERSKAKELFGTHQAPTELAQSILATRSSKQTNFGARTANGTAKRQKMNYTDEEKKRFQSLILKAKDLGEIAKLEKLFNEGTLPLGGADGDAMDET